MFKHAYSRYRKQRLVSNDFPEPCPSHTHRSRMIHPMSFRSSNKTFHPVDFHLVWFLKHGRRVPVVDGTMLLHDNADVSARVGLRIAALCSCL